MKLTFDETELLEDFPEGDEETLDPAEETEEFGADEEYADEESYEDDFDDELFDDEEEEE